jgi:hypothetical protein
MTSCSRTACSRESIDWVGFARLSYLASTSSQHGFSRGASSPTPRTRCSPRHDGSGSKSASTRSHARRSCRCYKPCAPGSMITTSASASRSRCVSLPPMTSGSPPPTSAHRRSPLLHDRPPALLRGLRVDCRGAPGPPTLGQAAHPQGRSASHALPALRPLQTDPRPARSGPDVRQRLPAGRTRLRLFGGGRDRDLR